MKLPINEIEITAKSFEDAVIQAAQQLNVDPSQIQAELIEENKKLFGRGNVKIKASVSSSKEEKKSQEAMPRTQKKSKKDDTKDNKNNLSNTIKNDVKESPNEPAKIKSKKQAAPEPKKEKFHIEIDIDKEKELPSEKEIIATDSDAEEYISALREILKLANIRVRAELKKVNGRYVYISLEGEDIGLLLVRRAETLNSLQYILNIIVFRKTGKSIRVALDAGEYRQKREDSLCRLAVQIAKEVVARKEEAVLDPLPAFERRIIHNHLQDTKGIRTYSEGDEPNRYVVIAPAE